MRRLHIAVVLVTWSLIVSALPGVLGIVRAQLPPRQTEIPTREAQTAWRTYDARSGELPNNLVLKIVGTSDHAIWIATPLGLAVFRQGTWHQHSIQTGDLLDNRVTVLEEASDGSVWAGTSAGGVSRFAAGKWTTHSRQNGDLPENRVLDIQEDSRGVMWLRTPNFVVRRAANEWTPFGIEGAAAGAVPRTDWPTALDREGALWIASPGGGVGRIPADGEAAWHSPGANGLPSSTVSALASDRSGRIWAGTVAGEVAVFAEGGWKRRTAFADASISGLAVAADERVWMLASSGQVAFDRGGAITPFANPAKLTAADRFSMLATLSPTVWRGRPLSHVWIPAGGPTQAESSIAIATVSANGTSVVLGTRDGRVLRCDVADCREWSVEREITALYASNGSTWIGTTGGLRRLNRDVLFTIDGRPIEGSEITTVAETTDGMTWVGTFDRGVVSFSPSTAAVSASMLSDGRLSVELRPEGGRPAPPEWTLFYRAAARLEELPPVFERTAFDSSGTARTRQLPIDEGGEVYVEAFAADRYGTTSAIHGKPTRIASPRPDISGRLWRLLPLALLAQVAFWCGAILFYPHSRTIQTLFLWNARFRQIAGLWCVDALIAATPWLGRRLLKPFRLQLVSLADRELMGVYYPHTTVRTLHEPHAHAPERRLLDLARDLGGHVLLVGASGTGKTHFVRYLLTTQDVLSAFVPAQICQDGVVEAVATLLPDQFNDQRLLEKLVFNGALRIYIDGLNEVNADTRATIAAFLRRFAGANVVVLTQPILWNASPRIRTFQLVPLTIQQTDAYLRLKGPSDPIIADHCAAFLADATSNELPPEVRAQNAELLSTPFDLDLVIELLAIGRDPSLNSMMEQYVCVTADDYERHSLSRFPWAILCKRAFEGRQAGSREIDAAELDADLVALFVARKVLLVRDGTKRTHFFRHDRVQDYFIARYFLAEPHAVESCLADVRFTGAFLALADMLPESEAVRLGSELALSAARRTDHSVVDPYVLRMERRRALRSGAPPAALS